jgi:hypothetical protein
MSFSFYSIGQIITKKVVTLEKENSLFASTKNHIRTRTLTVEGRFAT